MGRTGATVKKRSAHLLREPQKKAILPGHIGSAMVIPMYGIYHGDRSLVYYSRPSVCPGIRADSNKLSGHNKQRARGDSAAYSFTL